MNHRAHALRSRPVALLAGLVLPALAGGCGEMGAGTEQVPVEEPTSVPVADAGADQTVSRHTTVQLNGTASYDPGGRSLSFQWTQIDGPQVALVGASTSRASFEAPAGSAAVTLSFSLEVGNGHAADVATTRVQVVDHTDLEVRAGAEGQAVPGETVSLIAEVVTDHVDLGGLRFEWTQQAGADVVIDNADEVSAHFIVPQADPGSILRFRVQVRLGSLTVTDEVEVIVLSAPSQDPAGENTEPNDQDEELPPAEEGELIECHLDEDCDDGAYCNGIEHCVSGVCQAGMMPCGGQPCDESEERCTLCGQASDCDDGVFCNGVEICDDGACLAGTAPCPGQACDEQQALCGACLHDGDCDDGAFCNGSEVCVDGQCEAGSAACPAYCDEDEDRCLECLTFPDCDDGLFCNGSEACVDGHCVTGVSACLEQCDEIADECVGCVDDADCPDDGVFCNGAEFCLEGSCESAGDPCPESQTCDEADDACNPTP